MTDHLENLQPDQLLRKPEGLPKANQSQVTTSAYGFCPWFVPSFMVTVDLNDTSGLRLSPAISFPPVWINLICSMVIMVFCVSTVKLWIAMARVQLQWRRAGDRISVC